MEIVKNLKKDKVKKSVNKVSKNGLTNLKAEINEDWKTIKNQFGIKMLKCGLFVRRLFITDKK